MVKSEKYTRCSFFGDTNKGIYLARGLEHVSTGFVVNQNTKAVVR
jgi:hypothetical protein